MSHKLAKIARRAVRAIGHDPRDAVNTAKPTYIAPFLAGTGPGCMFHPRTLAEGCGRKVYRVLKVANRRGLTTLSA